MSIYQFMIELLHLINRAGSFTATETMLVVLGLIDVVRSSNLLLMVIVGCYGISAIHLLKIFIETEHVPEKSRLDAWLPALILLCHVASCRVHSASRQIFAALLAMHR
ncbi:MAG: YqhA family protein [Gammaproteobacteria bacterium]